MKGVKRKRAPKHEGAMRARGEVPLELQGVQWLSARSSCAFRCKECGGSGICEHGRQRSQMQGVRWGINLRARSSAL